MQLSLVILFVAITTCSAAPQFLVQTGTPYAHPAVLANDAMENDLPDQFRNPFYKDPNIVAGLARESWLTNKEMQVIDREADKIPREKVLSILRNAGLV